MKKLFLIILLLALPAVMIGQNTDKDTYIRSEQDMFYDMFMKTSEALRVAIMSSDTSVTGDLITQMDSLITIMTSEHNSSLNAKATYDIAPEWAHYTSYEVLMDTTNATAMSSYVYYNIASYPDGCLSLRLAGGVTVTVYKSPQTSPDFTDETTADWADISATILGAASVTDVYKDCDYTGLYGQWILVKYVKSDATNVIEIGTIKSKK